MDGNGSSGIVGLLGLAFFAVVYFLTRRFLPGVSKIMLMIAVVAVILLGILLVVVLYFAFHGSPKKQSKKQDAQGTQWQIDEIYANGRRTLVDLRMRATGVKNREVRALCEEICASADKILKTTKEHPENLSAVRQFLNYYLPTMGSILMKYVRLEASGISTADITEKAVEHLRDINIAMQKQYENLFAGDILDLSVEMEALTQACKRDGLLTEDNTRDGEKNIKLTI